MLSGSKAKRVDRTRKRAKDDQQEKQLLPPATRLAKILKENGDDHAAVLERLLKTLEDYEVPGPQLFRLEGEFSKPLGEGGEGNVRGINDQCASFYRNRERGLMGRWPFDLIAIKQHQRRKVVRQTRLPPTVAHNSGKPDLLAERFRAAECEVLALSPDIFRGHPNIVQLKGWGLCLDTIEQSESPCCGPLQIPLLVLERAEMNFTEFLEGIPEGFSGQSAPNVVLRQDPEAGIEHHAPEITNWYRIAKVAGIQEDPYETVRLLCIGIGHGLQALHENNFTHGDLKPDNVLIFRNGPGLTAKLCDFGCAMGKITSSLNCETGQKREFQREGYRGTEGWLPPVLEADGIHDYEGLRKCDIYIYGLVVWSAFYLRGDSPENPSLENAKRSANQFRDRRIWLQNSRKWLAKRIDKVFEKSLISAGKRGIAPWEEFYTSQERSIKAAKDLVKSHTVLEAQTGGPKVTSSSVSAKTAAVLKNKSLVQPPLTLDMKSVYRKKQWWLGKSVAAPTVPDGSIASLGTTMGEYTTYKEMLPRLPQNSATPQGYKSTVVSIIPLSNDDNLFSQEPFESQRRREDVQLLYREIVKTLSSWPGKETFTDLYCLARFRSRIPVEWWLELGNIQNIVQMALQVNPAVDICTLAWLCNGPTGGKEVRNLDDGNSWDIITSSLYLNESERLERFLLLLQFGAHVELPLSSALTDDSVLSRYIKSCRPATYPVVIREICRRFNRVRNMEHIAFGTKVYMIGPPRGSDISTIVYAEDHLRVISEALANMWKQLMDASSNSESNGEPLETTESTETNSLPPGWKRHSGHRGNTAEQWFEDEYTHSITSKEPKISLIDLRQVKIGFLDPKMGNSCYLDLAPYIMPGLDPQKRDDLDQNATTRFPYYDDIWFLEDWRSIPPQEDVLKDLREITSFTIRIPELGILDFLKNSLRWCFKGLTIFFTLLFSIVLCVLAAVVIILLVWVSFPVLLLATNVGFIMCMVHIGFSWVLYERIGQVSPGWVALYLKISILVSLALGVPLFIWELKTGHLIEFYKAIFPFRHIT